MAAASSDSSSSSRAIELLPEPGAEVRQLFILLHGVGGVRY